LHPASAQRPAPLRRSQRALRRPAGPLRSAGRRVECRYPPTCQLRDHGRMNDTASTPRPRLSDATLDAVPAGIRRPGYPRDATRIGIVHLGAGAFHRAHQAVYIDELLADEPEWAI